MRRLLTLILFFLLFTHSFAFGHYSTKYVYVNEEHRQVGVLTNTVITDSINKIIIDERSNGRYEFKIANKAMVGNITNLIEIDEDIYGYVTTYTLVSLISGKRFKGVLTVVCKNENSSKHKKSTFVFTELVKSESGLLTPTERVLTYIE